MPTRISFNPTQRQVKAALPHILYEIDQLCGCFRLLQQSNGDAYIQNAVTESALLHYRALIVFFERRERMSITKASLRKELDDVLCSDFGYQISTLALTKSDRVNLNKYLAHLTYSRPREGTKKKGWKLEGLRKVLRRALDFLRHIQNQRIFKRNELQINRLTSNLTGLIKRNSAAFSTSSTSSQSVIVNGYPVWDIEN